MRFSTVSAALAAFASTAAAVPVSDAAAASPSLSVKLSQIDNTKVKAVVTNSGKDDVDFVHLNFFRDSAPVKKVSVFRGSMAPFPPYPSHPELPRRLTTSRKRGPVRRRQAPLPHGRPHQGSHHLAGSRRLHRR